MAQELQKAPHDTGRLGPLMSALPPRQRAFIVALLEQPHLNNTEAARVAGYENGPDLKKTAYRLAHDPRVLAAAHEEARSRLRSAAILGASTIIEIARDATHKDRLKAAGMLLNRIGLHELSEHKVTVEHQLDDEQMKAAIAQMAKDMGVDPKQFLGKSAPKQLPAPIDGEFVDVTPTIAGLEDLV